MTAVWNFRRRYFHYFIIFVSNECAHFFRFYPVVSDTLLTMLNMSSINKVNLLFVFIRISYKNALVQLQLLQFKRILHIIHCAHTVLWAMTMADKPIAKLIHQQHWIWIQIRRIKCDLLLLDDATSTVRFHPQASVSHYSRSLFASVSCVTFFFFNYLLKYCIHILYKNQHFTHFVSVLMAFFCAHCCMTCGVCASYRITLP